MAVGWRVWCGRAEMASIMEQQRRVSQGGGRAKKTEFRCLKLLLLLIYFINYSGSATAGNSPQHVTGEEGDSVTLPCEFQPRDDSRIVLNSQSKKILDCQNGECTTENGRVFKKGSCDIIITHLIFSDAGKYILKVHNADGQIEVERKYHLHIQGEISVETGEQLKMDVLLINADKVEKNSSGEWTEVWTRGHGVSSDRLTDRDGNLTISNFTVSDAGTYRVLDSEGEIWITVTVTEFSKGLVGKIDTDKTEQHKSWIIVVCVSVTLLVLISALIWKRKRQHKNTEHEAVPMEDTVQ